MAAFFGGKGFYAALALCIVAAVVTSVMAINSALSQQNSQNEQIDSSEVTQEWSMDDVGVEKKENNVPVTSSSQSTQSNGATSDTALSAFTEQPHGAAEGQNFSGEWSAWPVQGEILAEFSADELVYNETMADWRTHNGLDIAAEAGAEVVSATSGTVKKVMEDDRWGTIVEVETQGLVCRYAGLAQKTQVKEGDTVTVGQTLGILGEIAAEIAQPTHLHFEVLEGETYKNPQEYLK